MEPTIQATIITIGDELLYGQVIDSNSAFIAKQLARIGIDTLQIISIHDSINQITNTITNALNLSNIVITTGGLGPTKDDITKKALCQLFNTDLIPNTQVELHVKQLFANRPNVINELTATQWLVPRNASILPNRIGSAPILTFTTQQNKILIALPGVPKEMEIATTEQIIPLLTQWRNKYQNNTPIIQHTNLLLSGIPESALAILLTNFENNLPPFLKLAYLPSNNQITLRLTMHCNLSNLNTCTTQLNAQLQQLQQLTKPYLLKIIQNPD